MSVQPAIISGQDQLARLLRGRREVLGVSQGALDDRINWSDGYTAKVESPSRAGQEGGNHAGCRGFGRKVSAQFLIWWVEALGLKVVLMDKDEAEALVAASPHPPMTESAHRAYPGRNRVRDIVSQRVLTTTLVFRRRAA